MQRWCCLRQIVTRSLLSRLPPSQSLGRARWYFAIFSSIEFQVAYAASGLIFVKSNFPAFKKSLWSDYIQQRAHKEHLVAPGSVEPHPHGVGVFASTKPSSHQCRLSIAGRRNDGHDPITHGQGAIARCATAAVVRSGGPSTTAWEDDAAKWGERNLALGWSSLHTLKRRTKTLFHV